MNIVEFIPTLPLALLIPAVWIDLRRHRIPNWLTGTLLLSGIMSQSVVYGVAGLGSALGGALVGFAIFVLPYLKRGMAAGDVKLMAASGACLGPAQALLAACASLIVGGGLAVLVLTYRYYREDSGPAATLLSSRFPYASAIALGTSAALILGGTPWSL